ncbi:MAG: glycosyltransferase 87 family protein [Streptosporangiaceae bacterium]
MNTGAQQGEIAAPPGALARPGPAWVPRTTFAAVLFAVSLAVLLGGFQAFSRHPWSMLDLRIYVWGGTLVRHSDDPYLYTYMPGSLHFTYTPMAAGLFALVSVLTVPVVKALDVAASVASLVGVLWLTWGALGYRRSPWRLGATLCVAAVALWLEPVLQTLSFGQVNLMLMFIVVADLCLPDSRWWKGIGVGVAAGFKLTPLIFIPYLLLTRRYRAATVAAATFGLTIAGSLLLLPKASEDFWLDGLLLNANRLGNPRYVGNQSLNGALLRLFGDGAAWQPYRLGAVVAVAAAGLLLAAWTSRRGLEMPGILVCALTGLLVSPVSWSHHWVWVAPALVVLVDLAAGPRWLPAAGRWRLAGWSGAVGVAILFSGLLWVVPALTPSSAGETVSAFLDQQQDALRGYGMTGSQQLVGDLYVLAALIGLGLIAVLLVRAARRDNAQPGAAIGNPRLPDSVPAAPAEPSQREALVRRFARLAGGERR